MQLLTAHINDFQQMVDNAFTLSFSTSANLEIIVLTLLLRLQVETSQTSKILLAHRLVHCGSTTNTLAVVVRCVRPPISLCLHVAQNHVLDRCRQSRHLPRDVGLPAAPGFTQVLQDCPCFVLLDAFRHHVQNVMHHLHIQHQHAHTSLHHNGHCSDFLTNCSS